MKLTILEAIRMTQPGVGIQKLNSQDLPVTTAYKVLQISQAIDDALQHYNTIRKTLLEQYGRPPEEDGEEYTFESQEDKEEFEKRITKLLEYELDIAQEPISRADLNGHEITAQDLALLMPVFEEEAPEPSESVFDEMSALAGID